MADLLSALFNIYIIVSPFLLIYILGGGFKSTFDDRIYEEVASRTVFWAFIGTLLLFLKLMGVGSP